MQIDFDFVSRATLAAAQADRCPSRGPARARVLHLGIVHHTEGQIHGIRDIHQIGDPRERPLHLTSSNQTMVFLAN